MYVAITRTRDELHVMHPLTVPRARPEVHGRDLSQRTRFLPDKLLTSFEPVRYPATTEAPPAVPADGPPVVDITAISLDSWTESSREAEVAKE